MKKIPYSFSKNERIIRIIYSDQHINQKTQALKNNFFRFDLNGESGKHELSTIRFEMETIEFCREYGIQTSDANYNRNYYGFACAYVHSIKNVESFSLKFTPNLASTPKNYFHTDIYDESPQIQPIVKGQANSAEINLRIEEFKKIWKVFIDDSSLSKKDISFKIYQSANPIK